DSDLPMSQVALAAGFRTVRRFNDAIRAVYGRTPSEIRRRRPDPRRSARDEYVFHLPYRPPYDWSSLLSFLEAHAIPRAEAVSAAAYRRTLAQEGRHGILEVRHDSRRRILEAHVRFTEAVSLLPIVMRVRGMFDVTDAADIARQLRKDLLLRPLVDAYP